MALALIQETEKIKQVKNDKIGLLWQRLVVSSKIVLIKQQRLAQYNM